MGDGYSINKGNGAKKRFAKFHKQVTKDAGYDPEKGDLLPYAPHFLDNLVQRIATGDLEEAVMEWMLFRTSGNQSLDAIHLYSRNGDLPTETPLWQRDCALDIAWIVAGHPAEWLDAPRKMFVEECKHRGIEAVDKSHISAAFAFQRDRGTIAVNTGRFLRLVPAPKVADSPELRERKSESPAYKEFLTEWEVAHSSELEEERVARSTIKRINKVRLSAYKKWKKLRTPQPNPGPSYKPYNPQNLLEKPPTGGRAEKVRPVVDEAAEEPPARPQAADSDIDPPKPPQWHQELKEWLKENCPIGTPLDSVIFGRIIRWLRPELVEQFRETAKSVQNPRKWAVYEDVAKQVAERGPVEAAAAGAGGSDRSDARAARWAREYMERINGHDPEK